MSEENVKNKIMEKVPSFAFGAITGALLIVAFANRDKIAQTVRKTLGQEKESDGKQ
jgi:hypothetical protein